MLFISKSRVLAPTAVTVFLVACGGSDVATEAIPSTTTLSSAQGGASSTGHGGSTTFTSTSNAVVATGGTVAASQGGTSSLLSMGGTSAAVGGSVAVGGSSAIGGMKAAGGTSLTGGTKATGGSATSSTGGTQAMGGSSPTGGTKATGGTATSPTGVTKATGGSATSSTGGTQAMGGSSPTGGTKATGGTAAITTTTTTSVCTAVTTGGSCPSNLKCQDGSASNGKNCGCYVVGSSVGLAARKKTILDAGGDSRFMASAMVETENLKADYTLGDGKSGDAFNAGCAKQNWYMIRQCHAAWSSLKAADYQTSTAMNSDLKLDIQVYNESRAKWDDNHWFAGHRGGQTGLESGTAPDLQLFIAAYNWTRTNLENGHMCDDVRFWVDVQAIIVK